MGEIKLRFQIGHFHSVTFSASSGNVVPTFNLKFKKKTDMFIIEYIHCIYYYVQPLSTCDRKFSSDYYFLDRICTVKQFI